MMAPRIATPTMGFIVRRGLILAVIATIVLGVVLRNEPTSAFRRDFVVEVPKDRAWEHFNQAAAWPSWAGYIKSVEVTPAGPIGPTTIGTVHLQNGRSTTFHVTAFEPETHWQWSTNVAWLTLDYDHQFLRVSDLQTRIVLHMKVKGFGKSLLAFVVGQMAGGDLDAAIPKLVQEMNERTR